MTQTKSRKMKTLVNKYIFILFFISVITASASAESLIEKAFVRMPDEYYLSMSSADRNAMLEAYKKDTTSTQQNKFKGYSAVLKIDSIHNFISIKNSRNGFVEMKLLSKNDSIVYIAVIFTACGPVCDSHIGFFAVNWQLLNIQLMPTVTIKDFLDIDKIKKDGENPDDIAEKFDIVFLQSSFVKNQDNIEVSLNTEKFMDKDNFEKLKPYLKGNRLLYTWKNGIFEKGNCYTSK